MNIGTVGMYLYKDQPYSARKYKHPSLAASLLLLPSSLPLPPFPFPFSLFPFFYMHIIEKLQLRSSQFDTNV